MIEPSPQDKSSGRGFPELFHGHGFKAGRAYRPERAGPPPSQAVLPWRGRLS